MFKFVQCLLILTSADGAHKPAVRDDATYRSVFPSKSAYLQEVSHFDSPMSVDDMEEGVTAHDEGKKEDDFSLVTTKEDEEGLQDASAATTAPETASTTVGIAPSGDINGPEMVGNPSQFFSLSEVVLEGKGACPTAGKPYCVFSTKWTTGGIGCKCVKLTDHFIQFKKQNGEENFVACEAQSRHSGQDECGWDHGSVRESGSRETMMIGDRHKADRGRAHVAGPQDSMTGSIVSSQQALTPTGRRHVAGPQDSMTGSRVNKDQASTPTGRRHFQQPQTSLSGPPPATPGTESRATPGTQSLKTYLDRQSAAHQKSPGSSRSTSATSHSPRPLKDFVNDQSPPPVSQSLKDYLDKQGAAHQSPPRSGGSNRRTLSTVLAQQTPSAGKGVGFNINGVSTESPNSPWH